MGGHRFTVFALVALIGFSVATAAPALAAPPFANSAPAITLSVSSGSAGTEVGMDGVGMPSKKSGQAVFGSTDVASFKTDRWGRFSDRFVVPTGYSGDVRVIATVQSTSVEATFTVTGPTSLEPLPTEPGTEDPVSVSELTWSPPDSNGYTALTISAPGTYNLYADTDYVIAAPERIDGAVHLRGGRNVVWIGGHVRIPDLGSGPVASSARRGLVISDMDDSSGDPVKYGYSPDGRIVHIEGLLLDGPDLAEGVNTNAPNAVVQLQNLRVENVHFRNSDDRDGTNGWGKNHPDVLQTWGSQKELRIDGLSGTSAYQGIFLKEDAPDSVHGPMWLRRVDVRAYEHTGDDNYTYAGHRMIAWYGVRIGKLHLDPGTVWVGHHDNSGWNRAHQNPSADTAFWRDRYWDSATATYVDETPPGNAVFTDALGDTAPATVATDGMGTYAEWQSSQVRNWDDTAAGRVYSGTPAGGSYVPAGSVGTGYASPGYQ